VALGLSEADHSMLDKQQILEVIEFIDGAGTLLPHAE
jgi:hypothetical protein